MTLARTTGASLEKARAAKKKAAFQLRRVPEVTGIGITRRGSSYALKVNLTTKTRRAVVPTQFDGVPVTLEVVGAIRKQSAAAR